MASTTNIALLILILSCVDCLNVPKNLSPNTRWAQNATTIAGSVNGTFGTSLNSLSFNKGIDMIDDDILYITDRRNNRIVLIAPNSTTAIAIIQNGFDSKPLFSFPESVFVTKNYIYVLDTWFFQVLRFFKNRTNPTVVAGIPGIVGTVSNRSAISTCLSLFIDANETLYVSDFDNNRVVRFPSNFSIGTEATVVAGNGTHGKTSTTLYHPYGIFVDEIGRLFIADSSNHRIQRWDKEATSGITVAGTGSPGNSTSELKNPRAVVVDRNGYMYILDSGNSRVLRWAPNASSGECIAACSGTTGIDADKLYYPEGLAFDTTGSLIVSDSVNNRVQKFQRISNFLAVSQTATSTMIQSLSTTRGSSASIRVFPSAHATLITILIILLINITETDSYS